jgi:hypothetical protein
VTVGFREGPELERRLGHQPKRYINRYTNPPEDIAAGYGEQGRSAQRRRRDDLR